MTKIVRNLSGERPIPESTMPTSYREPDERSEDQNAYFDYGARPPFAPEWIKLAGGCASWCAIFLLWALFSTMRLETALFVAAIAPLPLVPAHLLVQWLQHRRADVLVVRNRRPGGEHRQRTTRASRTSTNPSHESPGLPDEAACDSPAASRSSASRHS